MNTTTLQSPWETERNSRQEFENKKREAVVRAAAVAFTKHGYHGATMDMIAERLGISKPTLYRFYKNKLQLLRACRDAAIDRFLPLAEQARDMDVSAIEKIKYYQYASVEYLMDDYGRALALVEESGLDPRGRSKWRKQRDKITEIFRVIINEGIAKKEINPNIDPKLALLAIFGAFNSIATWFNPRGNLSPKEVCDEYFKVFLNGLNP